MGFGFALPVIDGGLLVPVPDDVEDVPVEEVPVEDVPVALEPELVPLPPVSALSAP
jgi:hypothetical protein